MHKRTLWIITILLSITLVGLILVQAYWIKNALEIKEAQFEQLVANGIDQIVKELENRELVSQVVTAIDPYYDINSTGRTSLNFRSNKLSQNQFGLSSTDTEKEIFIINTDSLNLNSQLRILGKSPLNFNKDPDLQLKNLNQHTYGSLSINNQFNEKLNNRTVFVENIVNKLIQVDVDIKERIDKETLEAIIERNFNYLGINIDYEYALKQNGLEIIYKSENYSETDRVNLFSGQLFPNDVFERDNTLQFYFPKQRNFILKSAGFIAITSIILTLIIILGFSVSIHVMFKQKRLSQIKNDFVNNMTHELKTPISTISLASQMLKDDSIPMESKNIAYISGIIEDESKRLSYQVEKVLKTALLEQGHIKLKQKELDVHKIIDNVVKNFEIQVNSRNGILNKDLNAKNSILFVDEIHFTNIIFNLLDNAVKYSNGSVDITVSTKDGKNGFYLLVSDKGIGIKKQDQKKVFDQFYRVSTGNVHDVKGFGLGLSYVKKIVNAHNGEINLISEYKKGSTFEIFIPTKEISNGKA